MNSSFRTEIKIPPLSQRLSYGDQIVMMGSCFADNIGQKLKERRFNALVNPFGIIYNPKSLSILIERILTNEAFSATDFELYEGRWNCFELHGNCSGTDLDETVIRANNQLRDARDKLLKSDWLVLTLGTSIVYKKNNRVVANCHKVPQNHFEKARLSVEEIEKSLSNIEIKLQEFEVNPKIIYTVSPVRHISNGLIENSRSKARLLCAIENTLKPNVHYFPAYEILLDDLRDYRFYKSDLVHPSDLSVDHIWKLLKDYWMNDEALEFVGDMDKLNRMKAHRPLFPESEGHQDFLKTVKVFEKRVGSRWNT